MLDPADRQRLTEIGHGAMPYWNPVDPARLERMLDGLAVSAGDRVIDIGCGRGAMLVELAARSGASGVGIDPNPRAIASARALAAGRAPRAQLEFRTEPFDAGALEEARFNALLCIGSLHAAGGLAEALCTFTGLLTPGGEVLIGEGYWKRDPDPEYLAHIGSIRDEMADLETTMNAFTVAALEIRDHEITSEADWDRYEGGYLANIERHASAHPEDPAAGAMLTRVRRWSEGYARWGRSTMGFVLVRASRSRDASHGV
jgi:SAM-dependent methyltransferase